MAYTAGRRHVLVHAAVPLKVRAESFHLPAVVINCIPVNAVTDPRGSKCIGFHARGCAQAFRHHSSSNPHVVPLLTPVVVPTTIFPYLCPNKPGKAREACVTSCPT